MDGISVHTSRENMGYKLANRIKNILTAEQLEEIDVVMVSKSLVSFDHLCATTPNGLLVSKLEMIRKANLTPSPTLAHSGDFKYDGSMRCCAPEQALPAEFREESIRFPHLHHVSNLWSSSLRSHALYLVIK